MSERTPFNLQTFDHHTPTEDQIQRIERVRDAFRTCARVVLEKCPDRGWRDRALEHLEDGAMLAVKSIVLENL